MKPDDDTKGKAASLGALGTPTATVASRPAQSNSPPSGDMLATIQGVIDSNRRIENLLIGGTAILFLLGVASVIAALVSGQFFWTIPSAGISALLYWPILRIEKLRNKNIALAAAAALIPNLPPAQAASEIQKLIEKLFAEEN